MYMILSPQYKKYLHLHSTSNVGNNKNAVELGVGSLAFLKWDLNILLEMKAVFIALMFQLSLLIRHSLGQSIHIWVCCHPTESPNAAYNIKST